MFLLHQTEYFHQCVLQTILYMAKLHQRHTKQKGLYKSNTEENKEIQKGKKKEHQNREPEEIQLNIN